MNRQSSQQASELPIAATTIDPSKLPSYEYEDYRNIGLNDLLAWVVGFLQENKQAPTFENITVAAYYMFPGKFSLVGYPQFPDATRIQLVILHLGPKYIGWLEGKKKTGYYLNTRGRDAARTASARLGVFRSSPATISDFAQDNLANRTAVETRIARLRNSASFKRYENGGTDGIDDVALSWDAFGLFITADDLTKAETYRQLHEAARRQKDAEVEKFLNWVVRERPHLVGKSATSKRPNAKLGVRRKARS